MRATTISMLVAGLLVGIGGLVLSLLVFFDHSGHKLWFYWIAPLLGIAFAGMMIQLTVAYWMRVGRLEVKGRPRK